MRRNEDYVPRRENYQEGEKPDELSPEVKKRVELLNTKLNTRLQIVKAIFESASSKDNRTKAFDEALKELTLQPKEKDVSDEEKKIIWSLQR